MQNGDHIKDENSNEVEDKNIERDTRERSDTTAMVKIIEESKNTIQKGYLFNNSDDETSPSAPNSDKEIDKNNNVNINNSGTEDNKISMYRPLEKCLKLEDTPFATKIELTADYQGSSIVVASDEQFGSASNLIKTTVVNKKKESWEMDNEEDGYQDGWLVKRHEEKAHVTIRLGAAGTVSGVDIDTTGYIQCAPKTVTIEGHLKNSPRKWTKIVPEVYVRPNSHNFFEVANQDIYNFIHVTIKPGGGFARLRCFGDVVTPDIPFDRTVNLASSTLGSQVIQKPRNVLRRDLPNIILGRAESSHDGWICPRDNYNTDIESEYTIIKLAHEGLIDRIIIDTKHFIGNAPKSVVVEGCSIVDQPANQIPFRSVYWVDLINEEPDQHHHNIYPNMFHVVPCTYSGPITHVRIRPLPDGGIQQILVKGRIYQRDANNMPIVQQDQAVSSNKRKRKHDSNHDENAKKIPTRSSSRLRARFARK